LRQRIQTLDGLRFLAAIGVLWIHAWTMHGNPRCYIGRIDLADFLAIGGNGVDLFFVISGFCMYYFYASKSYFSYHDFYRFLIKRWVRLSPAFYTATIVYLLYEIFAGQNKSNDKFALFTSIFYLNSILPQYNIAPHFWTLGVEWQFYFTIPFLLIYQNRIGFKKAFTIIFAILFLTAAISVFTIRNQFDLLTDQLIFRGVEFGFGIIAARLILKNYVLFSNRALWLIVFIFITFIGRVAISRPVLNFSSDFYNIFKLFGFTFLGAGFSGILYLSVTSERWLKTILGNRLFKRMGRISYSFYLWHAMINHIVVGFTVHYLSFAKGITAPVITTCICAIILFPIAQLSYQFLERPFLSIGNLTTK
jgi:peptidoglycan/LPS O-acetylase OafA/YrhL